MTGVTLRAHHQPKTGDTPSLFVLPMTGKGCGLEGSLKQAFSLPFNIYKRGRCGEPPATPLRWRRFPALVVVNNLIAHALGGPAPTRGMTSDGLMPTGPIRGSHVRGETTPLFKENGPGPRVFALR